MEVNPFVFQVDSDLVKRYYHQEDNYKIEFNSGVPKDYCVIYFSSNNVYYPNTEENFTENIVKRSRFEWFGTRIKYAHKHIFVRDIKKQWYLAGINNHINSPSKLIEFLKKETDGYKVIVLGSSAGGFFSVIAGQKLKAERIYSFNGQFEILSLLNTSNPSTDPILFRESTNPDLLKYFDATNFITNSSSIYYFRSNRSDWDVEQSEYAVKCGVKMISFNTSNHGIPFLKSNLAVVLNMPSSHLDKMVGKTYHPISFSMTTVGLSKTVSGLADIALIVFKRFVNKIKR